MLKNPGRLLIVALGLFGALLSVFSLLLIRKSATGLDQEELAHTIPVPRPKRVSQEFDPALITQSIILGGDGGNIDEDIRSLLERHVRILTDRLTLIFLGDNIYPSGLSGPENPNHKKDWSKINQQIEIAKGSGAKVIFVPGNHDWADPGPDHKEGFERRIREQDTVEEALGAESYLPRNGCPGPVTRDLGPDFFLVAADSEWWIATSAKPNAESAGCTKGFEGTLIDRFKQVFKDGMENRRILFVGHHPLYSVGTHSAGIANQDFGGSLYSQYRKQLIDALTPAPAFICAAGHDHSLQLIENMPGCRYQIVSGSLSHPTAIVAPKKAKFAASEKGFVRLDSFKDGRVRAIFYTTSRNAEYGEELFREWLH